MLTASDVAIHNNRGSCWIIIEGHVYDVTDFLEEHPGGPDIILRYAGKVFNGLSHGYYIRITKTSANKLSGRNRGVLTSTSAKNNRE